MHRREFICAVAGAVAGAPSLTLRVASAQQAAKVRRIGVLMGSSESDSGALFAAFAEELARLGWTDGRNARFEQRWTNGDTNRASAFAAELIGSQPDVIFCSTTAVTAALHRETSTIPIVFAIVSDPSGFVASLARPGGNITGFTNIEAAMGGKWLSLLKEIAPGIKRAAFVFNPDNAPGGGKQFLLRSTPPPDRWESSRLPCLYAARPRLRPRLPLLAPSKRASSSLAPSWPSIWERSFPRPLATTCPRFTRLLYLPGGTISKDELAEIARSGYSSYALTQRRCRPRDDVTYPVTPSLLGRKIV
jgi:hypothetical protein